MEKVLTMQYVSSLTGLCEINSSFDTGVLRIAYTGLNRNGSFISKEAFERCIPTMYNCPIVCNYDRETDSFGGHDVELVKEEDGSFKLINLTSPVGCIPERSKYFWDTVVEDDGSTHEYLCADVLIWKRQPAYEKIKADGVTAHSMEITVKDGAMVDGVYHIYDFEFTAFALIGVTPCFEGSALKVFSKEEFDLQFSEMMRDLKESFSTVNTSIEDDNTLNYSTEGGEKVLSEKIELLEKYGIDPESLDFSLEDYTMEELTVKFEAAKDVCAVAEESEVNEEDKQDNFELNGNVVDEIIRTLSETKVQREWGESSRYWYVDCDLELGEVYCWDSNDWLLYGFRYAMDGDAVVIDYDSKTRKKYTIVDFDEGEQASPFGAVMEYVDQLQNSFSDLNEKLQEATETLSKYSSEVEELRQFKMDTEEAALDAAREDVFTKFENLIGVEEFETLREHCSEYDVETLEEKCYAILGRNTSVAKFSLENKAPKLMIDQTEQKDNHNEPYGGLFAEYGHDN